MSDDTLAALERESASFSNDIERRSKLYLHLQRTGQIHGDALQLASAFGDPTAQFLAPKAQFKGVLTDSKLGRLRGLPCRRLDLSQRSQLTGEGLSALRGMPLEKLSLEGCARIEDDGFQVLKDCPLVELNAARTGLTDEGASYLRELPLRSLDLSGTHITVEALNSLRGMTLASLNLCSIFALNNESLKVIEGFPLKELSLDQCSQISAEAWHSFQSPSLESLSLVWGAIDDRGLKQLASCPLRSLNLSRSSTITDAGLAALASCPLEILRLRDCQGLTDQGLAHLSDLPLRELDLRGVPVEFEGLRTLGRLPLTSLALSGPGLCDEGIQCLERLALETLTLISCHSLTGLGLAALRDGPLKELSICATAALSDSDLNYFRNHSLESLDLSMTPVTSRGLRCFEEQPIRRLILDSCEAMDEECFEIIKGFPLEELNIRDCSAATDEALAQLKDTPLRSLNLTNCPVSDRGIKHLEGMPLETLFLMNTAITNDGLQSLRHLPLRELGVELCSECSDPP